MFKNHPQYVVETIFPDLFLKSQNWLFLRINSPKFDTVCFNCMLIWVLSKYGETTLQTTCFYLKAFLKSKRRFETSFPASFSAWFLKKNISFVIFYLLIKFPCLVVFNSRDIAQYVYCNCLLTRLWCHKFQN